jgi:hypothetical protein
MPEADGIASADDLTSIARASGRFAFSSSAKMWVSRAEDMT